MIAPTGADVGANSVRPLGRGVQHVFNEDTISGSRIIYQNMGHPADQFSVLDDGERPDRCRWQKRGPRKDERSLWGEENPRYRWNFLLAGNGALYLVIRRSEWQRSVGNAAAPTARRTPGTATGGGVVDEDMSNGTYQFSVLDDGRPGHECVKCRTKYFTKLLRLVDIYINSKRACYRL